MMSLLKPLRLILVVLAFGAAHASADPEGGLDRVVTVRIQAQALSTALIEFSKQAGVQVVTPAAKVKDLETRGVSGEMPLALALEKLLEGTKLGFHKAGANTIGLDEGQGQADTAALPQVPAGLQLAQTDASQSATPSGSAAEQKEQSSGEDSDLKLEEVVVTAQRREERLQEVPIAISVLSGEQLDDTRAFGGGMEVLTRTSGLNARPGVNTLGVRGVSAAPDTYQGPTTTALYLDGVPFSFVKNSWLPNLSVYDLDRIEVLRGPQGTLYGASALNGVVRVLTRDPNLSEFELKGRALISATEDAGSDNGAVDFAVNVPLITDKLAARAALGREDYGGWIDMPSGRDRNNLHRENLRLKVAAKPVEELLIVGSMWNYSEERDNPDRGISRSRSEFAQDRPESNEFDNYSLKLRYDLGSVSISSDTSYVDYRSTVSDYLGDNGTDDPSFYFFTGASSEVFSEEISINSKASRDLRWSVGAFYRNAKDNLFQTLPAAIPAPVNFDDESESWAAFGEATKAFAGGRFELTGGVRYFRDHVEQVEVTKLIPTDLVPLVNVERTFSAWSPRLVLSWLQSSDLNLYASFGKGFRSGYGQNIISFYTDPNLPFVQPDHLLNYELGAKGRAFDGLLDFEAAVYFLDWQDIQTQKTLFVPGTDIQIAGVVNGSSASGMGMDLSLGLHPAQGLTVTTYASWNDLQQDANVTDPGVIVANKGDRPEDSAEWTAGAALNYEFPVGDGGWNANFSASVNYASELFLNVPGPTSATQLAGTEMTTVRSSLALLSPQNWSVTLFAENLTNEDNVQDTGVLPFFLRTQAWMRPRTIGVQLDVKF